MCTKILINRGEKEIQTVREFKEHFGADILIPADANDVVLDDCCLCQIDVGAELKRLNIPFAYDYCDYYIGEGIELITTD